MFPEGLGFCIEEQALRASPSSRSSERLRFVRKPTSKATPTTRRLTKVLKAPGHLSEPKETLILERLISCG